MRRALKVARLTHAERGLLLRAAALLWGVRLGLWLLPFGRLRHFLAAVEPRRTRAHEVERLLWSVTVASRFAPAATCLVQALSAHKLLTHYGFESHLRIGVCKPEAGRLRAHAWLEHGGAVVLGQVTNLEQYKPLAWSEDLQAERGWSAVPAPPPDMKTDRSTLSTSISGVAVEVVCPTPGQGERLSALWRRFFTLDQGALAPAEVTLDLTYPEPSLAPQGATVWRADHLHVLEAEDGFYLETAHAGLKVNVARGRAAGYLREGFWQLPYYDQREFFLLTLLMLLRPRGRYGLHANALQVNGEGVLIVGASGAGKSTLTLSLLHAGGQFIADDVLLLRDEGDTKVAALRRGMSVTQQTEGLFELSAAPRLYQAADKHVIDLATLFPAQRAASSPSVLLFPTITPQARSSLSDLPRKDALIALMRQSAGLLTDRMVSGKQVHCLSKLVHQARAFRLCAGRDVYTDPVSVAALLEGAL